MRTQQARELSDLLRQVTISQQHFFTHQSSALGVTEQQARTLGLIASHPGMIQRELAEAFNRRGASVSNMLKNLERDGYIERRRDPANDRNKRLYLTDQGRQVTHKLDQVFTIAETKLTENLSDAEIATLLTTLKKIEFDA